MCASAKATYNEIMYEILKAHIISAFAAAGYVHEGNFDLTMEKTRGDFSTTLAMKLAKQYGKSPREIAEQAMVELKKLDCVSEVGIAGPGFLNLTLQDGYWLEFLESLADLRKPFGENQNPTKSVVVAEYSDPNPFKVLHAGHLYTSVVGDAIARLVESQGATVHRVNFGGDVGLHVAKTLWSILRELDGEHPEKLAHIPKNERSEWLARNYIEGTRAYEDDGDAAVSDIKALNKSVYEVHASGDRVSPLAQIYWVCRQWSYDYFDDFYARIGTKFDKYYPESAVTQLGLETVRAQQVAGVYELSEGAVIFDGEKHGLHTRVFINKEGLPTYEAKDVGLIFSKFADYHFDKSIVITGNEQKDYMHVVLKSIEQYEPELVQKTTHLTHGLVKLAGGVKMSSRKGNFLRAVDVLDVALEAQKELSGEGVESVALAAVKYSFLKVRMGGSIVYDPKESVSMVGNSGPYLQYAHARASGILRKASEMHDEENSVTNNETPRKHELGSLTVDISEKALLKALYMYPETVTEAAQNFSPHIICTYLYELSQEFNRFYESAQVIGDERSALRLKLVFEYKKVLAHGLSLLGIVAPESM
jgi:arginyl-tRNA synthetase